MHSKSLRAGLGACTATAVVLTAGLAMAPAAEAATTPTGGLLGGVTSTVTGVTSGVTTAVTGATTGATGSTSGATGSMPGTLTGTVTSLLTGLVTGTATPNGSPVAVSSTNGTVSVGLLGTTVGVNAGGGSLGAGLAGSGVGVGVGSGSAGTAVAGSVANGGATDPAGQPAAGGTTASSGSGTAPAVTGLRIHASVDTVYPVKDGYRDSVVLHVVGTTASGTTQPVSGVVVVKRGSTEVKRWSVTRSTEDLTWDGRSNGKVVAGAYTVTGVAVDATGAAVAATDSLAVSAKRLVAARHTVSSRSVSGIHSMAAKPKRALKTSKVLLRVTTTATGVVGKQYLRFTHQGRTLKVLIQNGTHTSKAVTVPRSFTTYRISHTWRTGTVDLQSVKYRYRYKKLS